MILGILKEKTASNLLHHCEAIATNIALRPLKSKWDQFSKWSSSRKVNAHCFKGFTVCFSFMQNECTNRIFCGEPTVRFLQPQLNVFAECHHNQHTNFISHDRTEQYSFSCVIGRFVAVIASGSVFVYLCVLIYCIVVICFTFSKRKLVCFYFGWFEIFWSVNSC